MKNTSAWILCFVGGLASLLGPHVSGEVGVVVSPGSATLQSGPYVGGIIEDADPINTLVWTRYSPMIASRVLLNENGFANGDGRPSVTRNPVSGLPVVVWGKNHGAGFDIVESHFENGGWTDPSVIAADVTTSTDPEPSIVVDRQTGDVHLVYFVGDSNPSVMHTQAAADLSTWNPPVLVSLVGEYALRPSPVIHQGTLRVAYESHGSSVGSTPRQIVVATSDGLGGFTHDALTSTHFGDPNRPQLHVGQGDALWIEWVDTGNDMAWSVWRPATGWGPVSTEPFTDLEDREYHVRKRVRFLATQ